MTLFEGNLPQQRHRQREREREKATKRERETERKNERKKEGERASWMPNAMVTAGKRAPQVEFPSSVLPGPFWMCTTVFAVYAKINGLSCMVTGYRFWGPYRFTDLCSVLCTSLTKNSCNTKVVFNRSDRGSYTSPEFWVIVSGII